MSGDVQPRKRKDKRKKKEEPTEETAAQQWTTTPQTSRDDDLNIHVHKERTTGGAFCAKFIFFILMAVIAVIIGLIITEYRGQTDLDTTSTESRFAPLFEGWVDKSQDDHEQEAVPYDLEHDTEDDHDIEDQLEEDREEEAEDQEDRDEGAPASEEDEETSEPEDEETSEPEDEEEEEEEERQDIDDVNRDEDIDEYEAHDKSEEQELDEHPYNSEEQLDNNGASDEQDQSEEVTKADNDDNFNYEPDELTENVYSEDEEYEDDKEKDDFIIDLTNAGVAAKVGVGVALFVVVYTLLLRKWKSVDKLNDDAASKEEIKDLHRRKTIVPPPTIEEIEQDIENPEQEYSEKDDESEEDIHLSTAKKQYEELKSSYVRPLTPEKETEAHHKQSKYEEEEGDEEEIDSTGDRGGHDVSEGSDSDEELMTKLEAKYGKLPSRDANDSGEDEEEEDEEDAVADDDDQFKTWKRVKVLPDNGAESESDDDKKQPPKKSGAQSVYDFDNITNADDYVIRDEIDNALRQLENNVPLALSLYTKILEKHPSSPRALYGKAQTLDVWAERKRSNDLLQDSVKFYLQVLKENNVPDPLFVAAAERCINRMRFVGHHGRAVSVHKMLTERFPQEIRFRNQLAVTYLTINRISEARALLAETLQTWPDDGFALVHYGFILKTADNDIKRAVEYMRRGLSTKEAGVIDGRFYFHLGDALARLGRNNDAMKVYEEGVENHVFLSKYQRSLYNVNRLTARPWWTKYQIPHTTLFETLEQNWMEIRNEGLAVLNQKGYFKDESENLRDVGDWKQFELYARGIKHIENCKRCPVTCKIVDTLPDVRYCKRGQVKFSVMHPGTHVWPHCGPTNCRLRIHLGLKVPSNTFIRVAEETKGWEEGKILIFDDSFEHEVWHNGTEFRLVLIVDVWHPELTEKEKQTLSAI